MAEIAKEFHGPLAMAIHSITTAPFLLAVAGVATAYYFYMINPRIPAYIKDKSGPIYNLLENKYYLDKFNEVVIAGGARLLGNGLWNIGDKTLIDGFLVNGSAKLIRLLSIFSRKMQSGYLYHYAFVMILGVLGFLIYFMPFPFAK